ncbi:MAG: crossover junction endodeoxyribonuclease RuvC, partial [Candidatus Neomarinimicrobiota bacterium]
MRCIIGIDPGLTTTGYGIIQVVKDKKTIVTWGTI